MRPPWYSSGIQGFRHKEPGTRTDDELGNTGKISHNQLTRSQKMIGLGPSGTLSCNPASSWRIYPIVPTILLSPERTSSSPLPKAPPPDMGVHPWYNCPLSELGWSWLLWSHRGWTQSLIFVYSSCAQSRRTNHSGAS